MSAAVGRPAAGRAAPIGVAAAEPAGRRFRLYVWQIPVRATHWVTALSILVLSLTGIYIASPFVVPDGGSFMTSVRFIHVVTAFVFIGSGLVRAYWMFAGNRFARWTAFAPTNRGRWGEVLSQTRWYLFLRPHVPKVLGHNALAAATYMVIFLILLLQAVTGLALMGVDGTQPWSALFGWIPDLIGIQTMRLVHHLLMWALAAFVIHHVYSALLVDHVERNGLLGSIFTGYKFVTRREAMEARDGGEDVAEELE